VINLLPYMFPMYINHEYDTYEACVRNVPEQLRAKKIFSCHTPSCACLLHAVVDGPARVLQRLVPRLLDEVYHAQS